MRALLISLLLPLSLFAQGLSRVAPDPGDAPFSVPAHERMEQLVPASSSSLADPLARLSARERQYATPNLFFEEPVSEEIRHLASRVTELWQRGDYDASLQLISSIDNRVNRGKTQLGLTWNRPEVLDRAFMNPAADVRVGSGIDTNYYQALAVDHTTGHLLAALLFRESVSNTYINVYHSTNAGGTWSLKTTFFWTSWRASRLGAAAVGNHFYIGYTNPTASNLYFRRYSTTDGSINSFPGGGTVRIVDTLSSGDRYNEIVTISNQEGPNNYIYCLGLTTMGNITARVYMTASDLVSHYSTGAISNAERGLSADWNFGTQYLWFSYISTDDSIRIYSFPNLSALTAQYSYPANGTYAQHTSIATHRDTIICAFEKTTPFTHAYYVIRYGSDPLWRYGTLGDTTQGSEAPAVTMAKDGGIGAIYRYYTSPREGRFIWRDYSIGLWKNPYSYTDIEPYYNQPDIAYLGAGQYGFLYLSWNGPEAFAAYFDSYSSLVDVKEEPPLPLTYSLDQNYPNPFNPTTMIRYAIPRGEHVRLTVYSVLGQEIRTLIDEELSPGEHVVPFDASDLASGVYLYRLTAGSFAAVRRMVVLK